MEQENGYCHADSMQQSGHLEANILDGGETLIFMQDNSDHEHPIQDPGEEIVNPDEEAFSQEGHEESYNSEELSVYSSAALESVHSDEVVGEEEIPPARDTDSSYACQTNKNDPTSIRTLNRIKSGLIMDNSNNKGKLILLIKFSYCVLEH